MKHVLAAHGIPEDRLPPIVGLLIMTGLSQVMALESALGVTSGHDTTLAFIEQAIDQIESSPLADDGAGSGGRS